MNRPRVAVVTGIPAPYRLPVFELLSKHVELKVFYCAPGHSNVAWSAEDLEQSNLSYTVEFLKNWTPRKLRRLPMLGYTNLGITGRLEDFQPDYVVVYGYNQWTHWLTFNYCKKHQVPFALRSDSNHRIDTSRKLQSQWRRRLLKTLVHDCAAVLPVGTANREYWISYGASSEQIYMAPFAIDNDRVERLTAQRSVRSSSAMHFLYAGRLVTRKGVDQLIHAFNHLRETNDVQLTIVGDGPEREWLKELQTEEARESTRWLGRLSNDDVFREFASADVFVLPSTYEPWGLVVNEAMAAGLPVIADCRCGAAIDLVEDGRTGFMVEAPNAESLYKTMLRCVQDPDNTVHMGLEAKSKIKQWTYAHTVAGFMSAIEASNSDQRYRNRDVPAHAYSH